MKQTLPRIWNKWKGFLLLKLFHVIEDRRAPKLQGEVKHTKTLICVIHLFSIPWMNKANTQGWQTRALYPPEIFKKKIGKDKKKRTKKKEQNKQKTTCDQMQFQLYLPTHSQGLLTNQLIPVILRLQSAKQWLVSKTSKRNPKTR